MSYAGGTPSTYAYDAAGRLIQRNDPGIVWKRTYDTNSGVLKAQAITTPDPANVLLSSDVYTGFDAEGNVTSEQQKPAAPGTGAISTRNWSFSYDDANRLKCMKPSDGPATRYTYDGQGDRLSAKTAPTCSAGTVASTVTSTYDGRGLLETMTDGTHTTHYCHDPAGALTAALASSGWSCAHGYASSTITSNDEAYRYDAFSDMVSQQVKTNVATTLTYDGLGRPSTAVKATTPSQTTYYGYSGAGHDLAKLEKSGVTTQLAYSPFGPFAQRITGAAVQYEMKNLHGDVVGLAAGGSTTTPSATGSFDPWGNPLPTGSATGVLGYQGDPRVEDSRLIQTDTRAIDPSLGRFMSQDMLFGAPGDPMSMNQYIYGLGSPVEYGDPSGMAPPPGDHRKPCGNGVWVAETDSCPRNTSVGDNDSGGGSSGGSDDNGGSDPGDFGTSIPAQFHHGFLRFPTTNSTEWPPGCSELPARTTAEYLGGAQCAPMGFFGPFGYVPLVEQNGHHEQRLGKPNPPGDGCSKPVFPGGSEACYTHDYGYDLIRAGALPRSAVWDVNRIFYDDLMSHCRVWELGFCEAAAAVAYAAVTGAGYEAFYRDHQAGRGPGA